MNLRHLQFFVVLAEELNFTRAAERLLVAQPALSQQIRTIESLIGTALFDRSSRPLVLTEAGNYFYAEARQMLALYEHATLGAREIGLGKRGWLGIGFTRSAMYSVLPPALKAFRRTQPEIELKLFEMFTEEQADALRDRRIHVGIGRQSRATAGCTERLLLREKLIVALAHDDPLTASQCVRVSDLADAPLVLYPKHPNAQFARFIESICRDAGFAPLIAYRAFEMQTALALVAAGLGVTLVGESVAAQGRTDVAYRPLVETNGTHLTTTLTATTRQGDDSATLQVFLETLYAHLADTDIDADIQADAGPG